MGSHARPSQATRVSAFGFLRVAHRSLPALFPTAGKNVPPSLSRGARWNSVLCSVTPKRLFLNCGQRPRREINCHLKIWVWLRWNPAPLFHVRSFGLYSPVSTFRLSSHNIPTLPPSWLTLLDAGWTPLIAEALWPIRSQVSLGNVKSACPACSARFFCVAAPPPRSCPGRV